jgi:HlyD family secretion protein
MSAPIIFVIAEDLRKMQVDTSVAEADVGKLTAGMDATFVVDAFPGERFKGKVRQIRNAAQTLQNVVTYDAVIDVDNGDLKLRPGMTANVNFVFANREDVLRIPNAALRYRPAAEVLAALGLDVKKVRSGEGSGEGNMRSGKGDRGDRGDKGGKREPGASGASDETPDRRAVWKLSGGVPQMVRIKAGTTDGTKTEVVDGPLAEGDAVITDGSLPAGSSKPSAGMFPGASPAPPRGGRPF